MIDVKEFVKQKFNIERELYLHNKVDDMDYIDLIELLNDFQQQLLNKHDVIRSAIGDDDYNRLARLIQLHEMLNNGQGLDDEQYDEHEQLVSDLDNILPLH